jgi:hypothetical protein
LTLIDRRPPPLRVAPLRLRLLAAVINLVVGILALVLVVAAGVVGYRTARRVRGRTQHAELAPPAADQGALESGGHGSDGRWQRLGARLQTPRVKLALALVGFLISVLLEGRRGAGYRVLGLRLVDARSGGRLTLRQRVVRVASREASNTATSRLFPVPKVPPPAENEKLQSQLEDARREHADDPTARQRAVTAIFKEHSPDHPFRPLLLGVARRLPLRLALDVQALGSPLNQSMPDKLAGTAVVLDPTSRAGRALDKRALR